MDCLIGHELYPRLDQPLQCWKINPAQKAKFEQAIDADVVGDIDLRDYYLKELMPHPEEVPYTPINQIPPTDWEGESMQDLRLSLKRWRFGKAIKNLDIQTPDQARV